MKLGTSMQQQKNQEISQQNHSIDTPVEENISNHTINITDANEDAYEKNKIKAEDSMETYQAERAEKELERIEETKSYLSSRKENYAQDPESYLLETSGTTILTSYEYMNLDAELAQMARNEIYARHGYIFKNENYQLIFERKNWYVPVTDRVEDIKLSEEESYNVKCLKWWEEVCYDPFIEPEKEGFTECYFFTMNQTFTMDLNNDGIQEEISYKVISSEDDLISSCSIEINGKVQNELEGVFEPYIWVVDIDPNDDYKELVIYDHGLSSDPVDTYYYYNGEELVLMGNIQGHLNDETYIEDGILHAVKRYDILGTTNYRWDYVLTDEHLWQEVPREYIEANIPIIAQEEITIYNQSDLGASHKTFAAGTTFTALGTDLKEWVKVKLKDESIGWININEYPTYQLGGLFFYD